MLPHISLTSPSSSILGMNLFGCKFCKITPNGVRRCNRKNFDSLLWATITVFQVSLLSAWLPSVCNCHIPLSCSIVQNVAVQFSVYVFSLVAIGGVCPSDAVSYTTLTRCSFLYQHFRFCFYKDNYVKPKS